MVNAKTAITWAVVLSLAFAQGCGPSQVKKGGADSQSSNLRTIASFYVNALRTLGHAPASEKEFKDFMVKNGQAAFKTLNITSPDGLFTSERDGKPLVIIYGKALKSGLVAHEAEGVEGKKLAAFNLGQIKELDQAGLDEALAP